MFGEGGTIVELGVEGFAENDFAGLAGYGGPCGGGWGGGDGAEEVLVVVAAGENVERGGLRVDDVIAEAAANNIAQVEILEGKDPIKTILEYAQEQGMTQIFVGHNLRRTWRSRLGGTPLDRLIRDTEGIDVRVFPQ